MSTNYLDTVTMYYLCPFDIRYIFNTHWIFDKKNIDSNFHHFCIKLPYVFIRFYPNLYGCRRLYVTFSLPKIYHQHNNNTFNVTDYDNHTFMNILQMELSKVLDITKLPMELKDWQPSRNDFFRMRYINPVDRKEYLYGYSRRFYRGKGAITYMNTNYLVPTKNIKNASIVEREYNKTIEQQDKHSILYGNLPTVIENEHEQLMHDFDISPDLFRYEFSLRRNAITRFIKKYNFPLNMETVMDEQFQKMIINDLIIQRGLHHQILSKKEYQRVTKIIFKTNHSQALALRLAESIRNKKPVPMSDSQQYRIKRELNSFYIDTATTNFVTIDGMKLL